MAKVGYIFKANHYDSYEADKEWMLKFGCVQVIEEETDHELMRPQWKQLMNALDRGDELVVSKFSNAVRGVRELAVCIEMCRIKVVRLISIHDRIDSRNELFKETTAAEVLEMIGSSGRNSRIAEIFQPYHAAPKEHQISGQDGEDFIPD